MIDSSLQPEALIVGGSVQSMYVYFRNNNIKETLPFKWGKLGRVLVYVGVDGFPVAMQFVDPFARPSDEELVAASKGMVGRDPQAELFSIAIKMITFVEANRQRLGDALTKDAIGVAKRIKPRDIAVAV